MERVVVTSASRPQPVNSLSLQPAARCPGWEEETTPQNDCNDNVIVFLLRHMTQSDDYKCSFLSSGLRAAPWVLGSLSNYQQTWSYYIHADSTNHVETIVLSFQIKKRKIEERED